MANAFEIKINGFDNLMQTLRDLPKQKLQQAEDEMEAAAFDIATRAKQRAPVDMGPLRNAIQPRKVTDLVYEVTVQKDYAGYVEFGTGQKAAQYLAGQPQGMQDYARQFYVNGQGRITPHPFFFPSFYEVRLQLIKRLTDIINK